MSSEAVKIDRSDAQCILDALTSALNAASGYLETDGCVAVRNLAKAIGVDPMTVTPPTFIGQYTHVPRLEAYRPHMYVDAGCVPPAGWRWIEQYDPSYSPGHRYAGRATRDPVQRCAICAEAVGNTLAGADHPLHRPWVDVYDLEALIGRCECGALPDAHDAWRGRGLSGHAYVDAIVSAER